MYHCILFCIQKLKKKKTKVKVKQTKVQLDSSDEDDLPLKPRSGVTQGDSREDSDDDDGALPEHQRSSDDASPLKVKVTVMTLHCNLFVGPSMSINTKYSTIQYILSYISRFISRDHWLRNGVDPYLFLCYHVG